MTVFESLANVFIFLAGSIGLGYLLGRLVTRGGRKGDKQAYIIGNLLLHGEIRLYEDGYAFYGEDKLDGRSLRGLLRRGALRVSGSNLMPSIGHIFSYVFYDDGVTDLGKKLLKEYLDSVSYIKRFNTKWMKDAHRLLEDDNHSSGVTQA